MKKPKQKTKLATLADCQREISVMVERSKTRLIATTLTLGLLQSYSGKEQTVFSERETQAVYSNAVKYLQRFMGHGLHIGAKWEDAYSRRTLPKYQVLKPLENGYELLAPYTTFSAQLIPWIENTIRKYIESKLGNIPKLEDKQFRAKLATNREAFLQLLKRNIELNPANFEFICFAVLRVHLEKFACKIYRDSRASAHDKGVDISTNFGVVYQIKKLRVVNQKTCDAIVSELQANFDRQRLEDGNVILVIDDIHKEFREFLINMKIQSISKFELMKLAQQFDDEEDRESIAQAQGQLDGLRKRLGVSDRGQILHRFDASHCDEEIILVEADGYGGAVLRVVEGNYPMDFYTREEQAFSTEAEALRAAESFCELAV